MGTTKHNVIEAIRAVESLLTPKPFTDKVRLVELMRLAHAMGQPDVAEVYSPPRVANLAHHSNLMPGFALDISVLDPDDGLPWIFDDPSKRTKALKMLRAQRPRLLIGSPMCKAFSILQGLNREQVGEVRFKEMLDKARVHL